MALSGPVYAGLMRQRDAAADQIHQIYNTVLQAGDQWSVAIINSKLDVVATYWQRFQNAQSQLLMEYADISLIPSNLYM